MLRTMMKSEVWRATLTRADLHHVDVTDGARSETGTIAGERGCGVIGVDGAAARLVHPGDRSSH